MVRVNMTNDLIPDNVTPMEEGERPPQGERLMQSRLKAGFQTQAEAIRRFRWKQSTYSAHESGQNGLTVKTARRYAAAYSVDWQWLLGVAENPATPHVLDNESVYQAPFDVKPEIRIWKAAIEAALEELGVTSERAEKITEVVLSVAAAQLPPNLGLTETEMARDLVQAAMRRRSLGKKDS